MSEVREDKSAKIRELNDRFRRTFTGGKIFMTPGISEKPDLACILTRVRTFEMFDEDNDPWHERDMAAFDLGGQRVMFKIDYYGPDMNSGSPDPSDPAVTTRVLTILLAEEY